VSDSGEGDAIESVWLWSVHNTHAYQSVARLPVDPLTRLVAQSRATVAWSSNRCRVAVLSNHRISRTTQKLRTYFRDRDELAWLTVEQLPRWITVQSDYPGYRLIRITRV